jgi:hypothetical protein
MENTLDIAPISEVFNIIDSCTNHKQLETCEQLAINYARLAKEKGVINFKRVKEVLDIKIQEKEEELQYIENFA